MRFCSGNQRGTRGPCRAGGRDREPWDGRELCGKGLGRPSGAVGGCGRAQEWSGVPGSDPWLVAPQGQVSSVAVGASQGPFGIVFRSPKPAPAERKRGGKKPAGKYPRAAQVILGCWIYKKRKENRSEGRAPAAWGRRNICVRLGIPALPPSAPAPLNSNYGDRAASIRAVVTWQKRWHLWSVRLSVCPSIHTPGAL